MSREKEGGVGFRICKDDVGSWAKLRKKNEHLWIGGALAFGGSNVMHD